MKNLIIAVAVLAIFAGMAVARGPQEFSGVPYEGQKSRGDVVWYDDIESGAPGWTHGDDSAQPHYWHIDSYMAYSGNSWWCGSLAITADGGYGNLWTQFLTTPYIDWTGYSYPVVTYFFRNDTEVAYDFSFAQAESSGSFVPLNRGYDGVIPWGQAGYYLGNKDNPAKVRFAFYSDPAYSDADGLYLSVGGAFAVDDVNVIDYNTFTTLFTDDADANVFMTTGVPGAAGDFWSIRNNACQAYSGTHYWSCTSPDTTAVPPNLQNWLMTPMIDISNYECVKGCTLYFVQQIFMSATGVYGGSWQEWGTPDGGATWLRTGWWWGHQCMFGTPGGPCAHYLSVIPIVFPGHFDYIQGGLVAGKIVMLTDEFGNGCDQPNCPLGYCSSGIPIDDTWIEVTECPNPVEESSWGKIKEMYR
ncbi:MAG: hypothetical protein ABIG03_04685 [Candidatus Eisenbacteria bacterium]